MVILKKYCVGFLTGLIWLRIHYSEEVVKTTEKFRVPLKGTKFLE
jgi:hypothetical protein